MKNETDTDTKSEKEKTKYTKNRSTILIDPGVIVLAVLSIIAIIYMFGFYEKDSLNTTVVNENKTVTIDESRSSETKTKVSSNPFRKLSLKEYLFKMENARKIADIDKDYDDALVKMIEIGDRIAEDSFEDGSYHIRDYKIGYYVSQLTIALEGNKSEEIENYFNYLVSLPKDSKYISITTSTDNWNNLGIGARNWEIGYWNSSQSRTRWEQRCG